MPGLTDDVFNPMCTASEPTNLQGLKSTNMCCKFFKLWRELRDFFVCVMQKNRGVPKSLFLFFPSISVPFCAEKVCFCYRWFAIIVLRSSLLYAETLGYALLLIARDLIDWQKLVWVELKRENLEFNAIKRFSCCCWEAIAGSASRLARKRMLLISGQPSCKAVLTHSRPMRK